jgi:hypothetical protein
MRAGAKGKGLLLGAAVIAAAVTTTHAQQVGDVFVIAMENHDWQNFASGNTSGGFVGNSTTGVGSNDALFNNPAAPFVNSLANGTSDSFGVPHSQVAYATNYLNAGAGEHPSEPNYVWAEAGTNFNSSAGTTSTTTTQGTLTGQVISNDADPTPSNNNILTGVPHLTGQLNSSGVSWQNFQEDYQILNSTTPTGGSPTVSKSGTSTTVTNPYYNTNAYNYAVKHNPMAFFSDTATQNVNTFDQLRSDLAGNTGFGRYNWITPNQFNDMHSGLSGGFTYNGTTYTGDQAAVATGDNFLKTIVPQIMATSAYQNNGAIIIWDDESEQGDSTSQTIPEFVISNLAHPNVGGVPFASSVALDHSSDIKTMEELFQLGSYINNPIPTGPSPINNETYAGASGGTTFNGSNYAEVAGSNDLSSLFAAGAIPTTVPEPGSMALLGVAGLLALRRKRRA